MLALVVEANRTHRDALVRHLQAGSYRVEQASDARAALDCLKRESPDAVVLAWGPEARETVKRVRSFDAQRRCYVLAVLDRQPASDIAAVFEAGVDDFVRLPYAREELLGRLGAPARLRSRGVGRAHDWSGGVDLRRLNAWRDAGRLVADDLAQICGGLDLAEAPDFAARSLAGTVALTLAAEETELRVSIFADEPALRALAAALLGDEAAPGAAVEDMLRELANTAGGAVSRAARSEEVALTTGLPVAERRAAAAGESARCWTATLRESGVRLGIVGEVVRRANQRVLTSQLREGMVVAHDIRNHVGALVLPAGTRLTSTASERLAALLGDRFVIEVSCAA
jgi:CheY-like chemotaxis protein